MQSVLNAQPVTTDGKVVQGICVGFWDETEDVCEAPRLGLVVSNDVVFDIVFKPCWRCGTP